MKDFANGRKAFLSVDIIPRNSKGGIAVSDAGIQLAFRLLDPSNTGKISARSLRQRLQAICDDDGDEVVGNVKSSGGGNKSGAKTPVSSSNIKKEDIALLMNGKPFLTEEDIKGILKDNEVVMDPIAEAFHMLDHSGCGYLTSERIRTIIKNLGHDDLADDELDHLVSVMDSDKDGKVSMTDFRSMVIATMKENKTAVT